MTDAPLTATEIEALNAAGDVRWQRKWRKAMIQLDASIQAGIEPLIDAVLELFKKGDSMKIIKLQAENIKKLVAVEITPDGNLVQITGKNGQGKTSVLDSIWWALAGASHIQASPIRKGATSALIRLDMGELIVTRTFTKKGEDEFTSKIAVENAEGGSFPSPQSVLDKLLGELSFDPLAFARASSRDQFDELRSFVPEFDFDGFDLAQKADYDARRDINRQANEAKAAANAITPALVPAVIEDEDALIQQMATASAHNTDVTTRKNNRMRLLNEANEKLKQAEELIERAKVLQAEAKATNEKIKTAPILPDLVDVAALQAKLAETKKYREVIEQNKRKQEYIDRATDLEKKSDALTSRMEDRENKKSAAIAAANLPVPGITFGIEEVLLNGVPFNQGSDAEQLKASIAIAMAKNPKLRVIRVRDGSLLDDESMKILAAMAEEKDYQVWIERVDSSGKVGFVLEDGHVRSADEPARQVEKPAPPVVTRKAPPAPVTPVTDNEDLI